MKTEDSIICIVLSVHSAVANWGNNKKAELYYDMPAIWFVILALTWHWM